jgi:hypothetical protein
MGDQQPTQDLSGLEVDLKSQITTVVDNFNEVLNMLEQAVALASDQITDTRIDLVEKALGRSSKYHLSDFFIDLLIATAISPLAAAALRTVTKTFVERVLNTNTYFLKRGNDGIYEVVDVNRQVLGKFGTIKVNETELLKPGSKNYDLWRVSESLIEPLSDAARTAAREIIKESNKPRFTYGTSPRVMFKNAMMSFALRKRRAHKKIWDEQVKKIDKHEYSEDELKGMLESWNFQITSNEHLDDLRIKYAKNFEALIWVLLCGGYKNIVKVKVETHVGLGTGLPGPGTMEPPYKLIEIKKTQWNVDPELVVYWLTNLVHPLGDGEQTFRDKIVEESVFFKREPGQKYSPLPIDHDKELKEVKYNQSEDRAQKDLKEYFKKLSVNTEIILDDPSKILSSGT